jgi:acylglycerol lipase
MKHFEKAWKSSDGLDIFAQGWNPDSQSPAAAVCLVHGVGEHTGRYTEVASALTDEGFAIMGADLRGHGKSGGQRGHFPSDEIILQDIDMLIDEVRKSYPGVPLILYGHSLGGILVLYYTLKRKPDLKGVIATSPALHNMLATNRLLVGLTKVLGPVFPKLSVNSGLNVNALSHNKKVIQEYINDPLVHGKVTLSFGLVMLGIMNWTLDHASEFPLPLLILHGKADSVNFPSGSTEFASGMNGNCKLVMWDEAYHELHNEPQKVEVFKTMISWITETTTNLIPKI